MQTETTDIKRLNYTNGMFVRAEEMLREQDYHLRMSRRHAAELHSPGVVRGLVVGLTAQNTIVEVSAGYALDFLEVNGERRSREIILQNAASVDLSEYQDQAGDVYLWISYADEPADLIDQVNGETEVNLQQVAVIGHGRSLPSNPQLELPLAKITFSATGNPSPPLHAILSAGDIDNSIRTFSGLNVSALTLDELILDDSTAGPGLARPRLSGVESGGSIGVDVDAARMDLNGALNVAGPSNLADANVSGLFSLASGASANEISNDATLADASATALVTEQAAKSYTDARADELGLMAAGYLRGELIENGMNPPSISAGVYDIDGTIRSEPATISLSFANDSLSNASVSSDYWYGVFLEADGTATTHILYGEELVSPAAIQGVSNSAADQWQLALLDAVDLSAVQTGMVAVILDAENDANNRVLEIVGISDTPGAKYLQVQNSAGASQATSAGTVAVHYRIAQETDPADSILHNPAESAALVYDNARNGVYSSYIDARSGGLRQARNLGVFYADGSGNIGQIHSRASGEEWKESLGRAVGAEPIAWLRDYCPPWAVIADGRELDRARYWRLFQALGVRYGAGDSISTFNVPDLRGEFLRGQDRGRGADPDAASRTDRGDGTTGAAVGTRQSDAFQGHRHTSNYEMISNTGPSGRTAGGNPGDNRTDFVGVPISDGVNGTPRVSEETRPRNVNVMYVLKY